MKKLHIVSLEYLRVLAVIMIVYDHLGGLRNCNWFIKRGVDFVIATPLNVIQDFGAFGVSIFFVISGFLFAWNAHYTNIIRNTMKRILKIYLSSLIAFLLFWLFNIVLWNFHDTYWHQFSVKQWVESITLLGYFTGNGEVINGTTWFLIPLFFFYLISIGYALLVKKFSWKGIWIVEGVLAVLFYAFHVFNAPNVPSLLLFVYMPLSGAILAEIYKAENTTFLQGILLLIVNYLAMVVCFYRFHYGYYAENLYLVSYIYAVFLVVAFFSWEEHFKTNKVISFIGKISLSVYLLQMTWGGFFMSVLSASKVPFTVAFFLTVGMLVGLAWLHTKYVEEKIIGGLWKGFERKELSINRE